jgi:hypothetical protein
MIAFLFALADRLLSVSFGIGLSVGRGFNRGNGFNPGKAGNAVSSLAFRVSALSDDCDV